MIDLYQLERFPHWLASRRWSFAAWLLDNAMRVITSSGAASRQFGKIRPGSWMNAQASLPEVLSPVALRLMAVLERSGVVGHHLQELGRSARVRLEDDDKCSVPWFRAQVATRRLLHRQRNGRLTGMTVAESFKQPWYRYRLSDAGVMAQCSTTFFEFSSGQCSVAAYLNAVASFLSALRTARDTIDEAYLEVHLVDAAFSHPLLIIGGVDSGFATSLPVSIRVDDTAVAPSVVCEGKHIRCTPTGADSNVDPRRLWPEVFDNAVKAARSLLWSQRRHLGRKERERLFNTALVLDLRPADAILSVFVPSGALFVFDESAGASFLASGAAALLPRRPPNIAATGRLVESDDARRGPQIDLVSGITAKFRFAAATRDFDMFCYPRLDMGALANDERAAFDALLALQERDHVTLSRVITAADVLTSALGDRWRRWKYSGCYDLVIEQGEQPAVSDAVVRRIQLAPPIWRLPDEALVNALQKAPTVWKMPGAFDVTGLLSYLRACSQSMHAQSQGERRKAAPGISLAVIRAFPGEDDSQLLSRLWDLLDAPEEYFYGLMTSAQERQRIDCLATAIRVGAKGTGGAELIIIVGGTDRSSSMGGPFSLERMFADPSTEQTLRNSHRHRAWQNILGNVRIIFVAEPVVVHKPMINLSLESSIILASAAIFRGLFTATQALRVMPDGLVSEVSEVQAYLEGELQATGCVAYWMGRWMLTSVGRNVVGESSRGMDDHLAAAGTFGPQTRGARPQGSISITDALKSDAISEWSYHLDQMDRIANEKQLSRREQTRLSGLRDLRIGSMVTDGRPTWATVCTAERTNSLLLDQVLEVAHVLADFCNWDAERLAAQPLAVVSWVRLIVRRADNAQSHGDEAATSELKRVAERVDGVLKEVVMQQEKFRRTLGEEMWTQSIESALEEMGALKHRWGWTC